MITSRPQPSAVNIATGTHSGLRFFDFGVGAVYRFDPGAGRALAGGPSRRLLPCHAVTVAKRPPRELVGRLPCGVAPRVLVIDNYDSFVYNLVQYLGELGAEPVVHRHDALDLDALVALAPDAVLVSPGPGPARGRGRVQRRDPCTSATRACRCSGCASATSASARSTAATSCGPRT